ncbi:MAG: HAMP domain-containing sensor histidine kinase [Thermoleophilia bacterium]
MEPIDATDLLEGVRNRFLWRAADAGQELTVEAAPGLTVSGDRLRLEQALGNLADNALRYGAGRVTLRANPADGTILLAVDDQGPGFPASFLPRAFDRFSRPDDGRSGGGAGLGLAIVATIAQAHGGTAHAKSRPDGGATVTIELPA